MIRPEFFCPRHNKTFTKAKGLREHLKTKCEISRKFRCPHCGKCPKRRYRFDEHHRTHHINERLCDVTARSTRDLRPVRHALGCGLCTRPFLNDPGGYVKHLMKHCRNGARLQDWDSTAQIVSLMAQSVITAGICTALLCNHFGPSIGGYARVSWDSANTQELIATLEGDLSISSDVQHQLSVQSDLQRILGLGCQADHPPRNESRNPTEALAENSPSGMTVEGVLAALSQWSSIPYLTDTGLRAHNGDAPNAFGIDNRNAGSSRTHVGFQGHQDTYHPQLSGLDAAASSSQRTFPDSFSSPHFDAIHGGDVSFWIPPVDRTIFDPSWTHQASGAVPAPQRAQCAANYDHNGFPSFMQSAEHDLDQELVAEVLFGPVSQIGTSVNYFTTVQPTYDGRSLSGFTNSSSFVPHASGIAPTTEPEERFFNSTELSRYSRESNLLQEMGSYFQSHSSND